MEDLTRIIAHNISALRTACGMTQLELAERLNYSDKLVSKWERGDAAPNAITLKQLSDIFGVTVDYLFTDHSGESVSLDLPGGAGLHRPEEDAEKTIRDNRRLITAISMIGIWMLTLMGFIITWIIVRPVWQIFVYALPVSVITLLVLNSVWNRGRRNFYIISVLVASVAAVIYVSLLEYNCWQIFILLIPAELLVLLSTRIKLPKRRK